MTALACRGDFSIITISETGDVPPVWTTLLGWPSTGDRHVALRRERGDRRSVWASQLDDAVLRADRAVVLVADGIGCFAASWWARLSPSHYVSRVAGALLLDPQGGTASDEQRRQFESPAIALPFPAVVLAERGEGERADQLRALAADWGGRFYDGRRTRQAERSAWHTAQRLVARFTAQVVEQDTRRAMALIGRTG